MTWTRERIERLLDKDSFHEIGAIAGKAQYDEAGRLTDFMASNFVMGRGRIDGRTVAVGGDDFTVRGGAADASIWEKQMMSEQMAGELGIPMVRLVDGTGGGGSVKTYEMTGFTYVPRNPGWEFVVDNLARVPVVSLGLGSVAGLGAARLATSHYSLMVKGISQMFVAGPPVVALEPGRSAAQLLEIAVVDHPVGAAAEEHDQGGGYGRHRGALPAACRRSPSERAAISDAPGCGGKRPASNPWVR